MYAPRCSRVVADLSDELKCGAVKGGKADATFQRIFSRYEKKTRRTYTDNESAPKPGVSDQTAATGRCFYDLSAHHADASEQDQTADPDIPS